MKEEYQKPEVEEFEIDSQAIMYTSGGDPEIPIDDD
jgi:hypothetical protein